VGTKAFAFDEAMALREAPSSTHQSHHDRRVFEGYVSDK
jgi:hypothetical protein